MRVKLLLALFAVLSITTVAVAQNNAAALASLPEADAIIYVSPQRILNEAAPRVIPPADLAKMRETFAEIKKSAGIDPSTIEYLVLAVRFNKPATDLSFVAPDVMAVFGGDFSADSLISLGQLYLQDKARVEKYETKSIMVMKVDPIAIRAETTPILKPYSEVGIVPLSANSIAIGNLNYLRAAIDAAEGKGRMSAATLESLLRDPNVLASASGAPLTAFIKSIGMMGLENTSRPSRCDTPFGNFYAAITMTGTNFSLRGAMNADNPDTAKIINNLLSGLIKEGISAVPDKQAQMLLQNLKMSARENEIVWEADIPEKTVAEFIRTTPKATQSVTAPAPKPVKTRKPVLPKKRTTRKN
ncbi:MAG TPA: hypothetical protein VFS90_23255 [Pyrinomonadaceae bacterium]|nr:hypothetical protein [Pyrinomonadaceae bacterium]